MKTIKFSLFLFLATAGLTFTSCSKDDAEDGGTESAETFIRFSSEGADFDFTNIVTAESGSVTLNGDSEAALDESGDTALALWFPTGFTKGSHDIESDFANSESYRLTFTSESMDFKFVYADSGTINIEKMTDDYIEGTFSASVTNKSEQTINITNGTFKAYTVR